MGCIVYRTGDKEMKGKPKGVGFKDFRLEQAEMWA